MKKIICGLAILLSLGVSVFAAPTAEQLAAKGIETKKGNDGNTYYVYPEINEPVVGKRYMLLNYNKEAKLQEDNGFYAVVLYEVIAKTDENAYKVGGKYVRSYPTAAYRITDSSFKLGKIITFKSVEDIFGKDAFVSQTWTDWGWATQDPDLKIMVRHKFQNNTVASKSVNNNVASKSAAPTAEQLAKRGIETSGTFYIYSVMNEPVKGKSYMCLSWHRKTEKMPDDDGYYNVFLHEVIKSTDENSVEVNGTYVRYYPSLTVRINVDAVTFGDIIVFDSVETLFGKEWVTIRGPINNWGYATKDPVLDIDVNHKYRNHYVMVEK